jgi:hypothetical protein
MSQDLVSRYLDALAASSRTVAPGEWGVSIDDVAGWPLHVGLKLGHDLLRAQAEVVGPGAVDDHEVLFRNRSLAIVRYAHTGAGAVWVVGDLPQAAVDERELDRLLGLVVSAAADLRRLAGAPRAG